jgi:hypothetical protein
MNTELDARPSPIAGQWYPSDPVRLASSVDQFIHSARLPQLAGDVVAVIAPHAGHRYSGPVAGYAFAALCGLQPELVTIVSPMHYITDAILLTTAHAAYQTPLGVVPVDQQAVEALEYTLKESDLALTRLPTDPEHSLEIELPFLQRALASGFSLLPVMVREASVRVAHSLGLALAQVLAGRRCLLVASSDLSHFYPQHIAQVLDREMLRRIEAFDPQAVLQAEEEGMGFACGRGAVAAVLWAARELGADQVTLLNYATSGEITRDFSQVVGYGAAVITRSHKA